MEAKTQKHLATARRMPAKCDEPNGRSTLAKYFWILRKYGRRNYARQVHAEGNVTRPDVALLRTQNFLHSQKPLGR